jgi:hypothetical protein
VHGIRHGVCGPGRWHQKQKKASCTHTPHMPRHVCLPPPPPQQITHLLGCCDNIIAKLPQRVGVLHRVRRRGVHIHAGIPNGRLKPGLQRVAAGRGGGGGFAFSVRHSVPPTPLHCLARPSPPPPSASLFHPPPNVAEQRQPPNSLGQVGQAPEVGEAQEGPIVGLTQGICSSKDKVIRVRV